MAEEQAVELELEPTPNEEPNDEPQLSPAEEKARSQGWVSEDEWVEQGKDADDWVDAKQFVFRGELMQRIQQQSKQLHESTGKIDQLTKALQKMGEMNSKIAEEQYKKALQTLKRQKAEALSDEDHDAVVEIEDQIDEIKEAQKALKEESEAPKANETSSIPPEFTAWIAENSWYNTDPVLKSVADTIGSSYAAQNPDLPPAAVLDYVARQVKLEMPHKFGGRKPQGQAVIEKGGRPNSPVRGKKPKYTAKDLDDEQLKIGKTFVDTGALPDIQAYVDQLVEIGELG